MLMFAYILQYLMYALDANGDAKCWTVGQFAGMALTGLIYAFGEALFAVIVQKAFWAAYRALANFGIMLVGEATYAGIQGTYSEINKCMNK